MSKAELWQTDKANYPFATVTQTRFGDMDVLGHINNVSMADLFENGRVRFNRSLELENRASDERWLIAAIQINYVREAHFPNDVEIASGIGRIGRSSWDIYSAAFQKGECVATCITTLVLTDKNGSKPMAEQFAKALNQHLVQRS